MSKIKIAIQGELGAYSHIAVEIETGRTHQIRVHLSHQKLPIIGDSLYNSRNLIAKNTSQNLIKHIQSFPRQALHASKIRFPAAVSISVGAVRPIRTSSSLPPD